MANIKIGSLSIPASEYGSQGNAILGIRDSGKTYTATGIAEQLYDAGIPFVAFDPIGVWRYLRVPGKGKGYPVVVAGGAEGDLPLSVAAAPEIVRAAMKNGVSLVIDLFDINLSKADWKRIVTSCVKVLLHENQAHGLRHIFIEEAAEFAPQRPGPDQSHVYAEMEKLARMGGNSRLGYTLINQRSEEVSKAVLELCDSLLLHRQKGRNSLNNLSKWLDVGNVSKGKEIIASLSTLEQGKCWAWLAGMAEPVLVKIQQKNSFSPNRRTMRGDETIKGKAAVDVKKFVAGMTDSLTKIMAEAENTDPEKLRQRIAVLQKEIKKGSVEGVSVSKTQLRDEYRRGYGEGQSDEKRRVDAARQEGYTHGLYVGQLNMATLMREKIPEAVNKAIDFMTKGMKMPVGLKISFKAKHTNTGLVTPVNIPSAGGSLGQPYAKSDTITIQKDKITLKGKVSIVANGDELTTPECRVMKSLAFWCGIGQNNPSREQVAAVAGYSPGSGNYKNVLGGLRGKGMINYPSPGTVEQLVAAESEIGADEAKELLLSTLDGPQKKVLNAIREFGSEMTREQLADASEYSASSGNFKNILGSLCSITILHKPSAGMIAVSDWVLEVLR